jgi:hypothetical protein
LGFERNGKLIIGPTGSGQFQDPFNVKAYLVGVLECGEQRGGDPFYASMFQGCHLKKKKAHGSGVSLVEERLIAVVWFGMACCFLAVLFSIKLSDLSANLLAICIKNGPI